MIDVCGRDAAALLAWADAHIGVPYRDHGRDAGGWDCWGVLCAAYRDQFAIDLPDYTYASAADIAEVRGLVAGGRGLWREIPEGEALPGDLVLLRHTDGSPVHVGLYLGRRTMLHVYAGIATTATHLDRRYLGLSWRERLDGFGSYRRFDAAGAA